MLLDVDTLNVVNIHITQCRQVYPIVVFSPWRLADFAELGLKCLEALLVKEPCIAEHATYTCGALPL